MDEAWLKLLKNEFESDYMSNLEQFVYSERLKFDVFPASDLVFHCFEMTPLQDLKVVILGQDPYHGPGQAHGLSFSVSEGQKLPPSLRNIFKELKVEYPEFSFWNGDLTRWAKAGVLLLNATLTVRAKQPGSHQNQGWELFTDAVIRKISENTENVVFMLWGKFAQSKALLINEFKHCVLQAAHPSPFSAHRGFFGCNHFLRANKYLESNGLEAVDWNLD